MLSLNLSGILDVLASQEVLLGAFLVGAGLVFLIFGFRVSRPLVAISYGVIGFVMGGGLPFPEEMRVPMGILGALSLGSVSTYFPKGAIVLLTSGWSAYAALLVCNGFDVSAGVTAGVVAVAGLGVASLGLVMLREMTAMVLSMEGSLLLIGGLVIFCNQSPSMWSHIRDMMVGNPIFAPFVLLAGTVTGFYLQLAELRQCDAGTSA